MAGRTEGQLSGYSSQIPPYHWTLIGTNTGPGGAGQPVRISGFELWKIAADGLIASSHGHFDSAEYQRQLDGGR